MNLLFHKPVVQANEKFTWVVGDADPADTFMLARDTAWALLHRVRQQPDSQVLRSVIELAETEGIDEIAQLWAGAHSQSLPGVLWRIYLLREVVTSSPELVSELYRVGLRESQSIDGVVAGAKDPINPAALKSLSDEILRGLFVGNFGAAIERAAATCGVFAAGAAHLADDRDLDDEVDATRLTKQALRFDEFARDLRSAAHALRHGSFE